MRVGALIAILAAAAVLGWLYVSMKPGPQAVPAPPSAVPSAAVPGPAEFGAPVAREFTLTVKDGQLSAGPGVLRVTQGASVLIRVSSDHADQLHLHGYDLELALRAGQPGVLAFTADRAGRFDLELHHAHLELGALEVQPR